MTVAILASFMKAPPKGLKSRARRLSRLLIKRTATRGYSFANPYETISRSLSQARDEALPSPCRHDGRRDSRGPLACRHAPAIGAASDDAIRRGSIDSLSRVLPARRMGLDSRA